MLMANPAAALSESRRVLRPGGRLALAVFGAPQRNPFFATIATKLVQGGHMPPPEPAGPGIFAMASEERTRALLVGAGFREVRTDEVPMRFPFGDVHEYVSFVADTAGPVAMALRRLPEQERERMVPELEAALAPHAAGAGYEFPGISLVAVAS
jgi:hypothetical protein